MKLEEVYTSGEYLEKNPTWHVEESPWKAKQIMRMLAQIALSLKPYAKLDVELVRF
ncbi:MAG TPA: hypothetical protein VNE38_16830 [Ktedonobacteraceae bacterium]|nr:hypothetical protein [Ktedonobacteraceae bacterium]